GETQGRWPRSLSAGVEHLQVPEAGRPRAVPPPHGGSPRAVFLAWTAGDLPGHRDDTLPPLCIIPVSGDPVQARQEPTWCRPSVPDNRPAVSSGTTGAG